MQIWHPVAVELLVSVNVLRQAVGKDKDSLTYVRGSVGQYSVFKERDHSRGRLCHTNNRATKKVASLPLLELAPFMRKNEGIGIGFRV